jgi:L-rhamnose mutarotase
MARVAFKMKLHEGRAAEYKARHEAIWPELSSLLKDVGISNYSIYLDEDTHLLFAVMEVEDPQALDHLPDTAIMKKWWLHMADIMDTNADHSPVSIPLQEMFFLL